MLFRSGDVVHRDNDVFGDGVNIASRVEPLANPGGICITEDVFRQIQNKTELDIVKLGKGSLKNIKIATRVYKIILLWEKNRLPLLIRSQFIFKKRKTQIAFAILFAIILGAGGSYLYKRYSKIPPLNKSIAVLPLKNLNEDKADDYFSDGITEDIITQLSKISELKVISHNSAMHYKNIYKPTREIADELNVAAILEGSIRREGENVRITTQLIDATTSKSLWAETYDRKLKNIFAIQSDVAGEIANALWMKLTSNEKKNIKKKPTDNTIAYELYLKGRYYWNKRNSDDFIKAIDFYNQAIKIDSNYAYAYVGLAECYVLLPYFSGLPTTEFFQKSINAAMKAIQIDSTLGEAYASLAFVTWVLSNSKDTSKVWS